MHPSLRTWMWAAAALAAPLSLTHAASTADAVSPDGRYIVVFKTDARDAAGARAGQAARMRLLQSRAVVHHDLTAIGALAVSLGAAERARLAADPGVAYVEPDARRYLSDRPLPQRGAGAVQDDPAAEQAFPALAAPKPLGPAFSAYSTPSAAPFATGQRVPYAVTQAQVTDMLAGADRTPTDVRICEVDSGIDRNHEDFAGVPLSGEGEAKAGPWYVDGYGHGTHVAGTMIAVNQKSVGVVGAAPSAHVSLHAVKVFNGQGLWTYSSDVIDAVRLCQAAGARLVNMSLGGLAPSKAEATAMQQAEDAGMLMVGSAGNQFGLVSENYPATYDSVISVAALKPDGSRMPYSSRHKTVELAAGGWEVLSTYPMRSAGIATLSVAGTAMPLPRWVFNSPTKATATGDLAVIDSFNTNPKLAGKVCYYKRRVIDADPTRMIMDQIIAACQASGGVGFVAGNDLPGSLWGMYQKSKYNPKLHIPAMSVSDTVARQIEARMGQSATLGVKPTNYAYEEGTSMATPQVTGVAAAVWSYFPECTNKQIRATLTKTAKDLGAPGRDIETGFGMVQAKAAYDRLKAMGCSN